MKHVMQCWAYQDSVTPCCLSERSLHHRHPHEILYIQRFNKQTNNSSFA